MYNITCLRARTKRNDINNWGISNDMRVEEQKDRKKIKKKKTKADKHGAMSLEAFQPNA
jgi:hypothetical protein